MDSIAALSQLRNAKSAMLHWREYAHQRLVSGVVIGSKGTPVAPTQCEFGKWFHGAGAEMLGHIPQFCTIRDTHSTLYEVHKQIHHYLLSDELEYAKQQWKHFTHLFHQMLDAIIVLEKDLEHQIRPRVAA
ncbi:MAG: hypothetical protein WC091_09045 [Sulfuricellaceae bacterium]